MKARLIARLSGVSSAPKPNCHHQRECVSRRQIGVDAMGINRRRTLARLVSRGDFIEKVEHRMEAAMVSRVQKHRVIEHCLLQPRHALGVKPRQRGHHIAVPEHARQLARLRLAHCRYLAAYQAALREFVEGQHVAPFRRVL